MTLGRKPKVTFGLHTHMQRHKEQVHQEWPWTSPSELRAHREPRESNITVPKHTVLAVAGACLQWCVPHTSTH